MLAKIANYVQFSKFTNYGGALVSGLFTYVLFNSVHFDLCIQTLVKIMHEQDSELLVLISFILYSSNHIQNS